ncbi:MAG: glycosyltransferase family 39 protein [Elusimicrobiales bacterium]|nr:glycosyltransferase family 39 protein [Elusimicrobiales bacterium]
MIIISITLRIIFFFDRGIIYFGDSHEYIEVISNISNGYGFYRFDIIEKKLMPYSNKMPLFFYMTSFISNLLNKNFELSIFIINCISITFIIILTIFLSFKITQNIKTSILSGWIIVFNPNLFINSMMLMADTFYAFIIIIFNTFFIYSILNKSNKNFFLSGIFLGISVLTRAILKFYWIILTIGILLIKKNFTKKRLMLSLSFMFGYLIIIIPYHIRNYIKLGIITPLELHQGIASAWPTMKIIKKTNYSTLEKKYPKINELHNFFKSSLSDFEGPPELDTMKKFGLNSVNICKYLTTLSLYAIISNPFEFILIYTKNLINTITSSSSYLLIINIFNNNFFEQQHKEFLEFILYNKKITINVMINILFRILNLLLFSIVLCQMLNKMKNTKSEIIIYLLVFYIYTILFSSLTVGYDRYRVPIEFINAIFLSTFISEKLKISWN